MKDQKDYFCSACEWTDRVKASEILTECPICGGILTELSAETEEKPTVDKGFVRYNPKELKKIEKEKIDDLPQ